MCARVEWFRKGLEPSFFFWKGREWQVITLFLSVFLEECICYIGKSKKASSTIVDEVVISVIVSY